MAELHHIQIRMNVHSSTLCIWLKYANRLCNHDWSKIGIIVTVMIPIFEHFDANINKSMNKMKLKVFKAIFNATREQRAYKPTKHVNFVWRCGPFSVGCELADNKEPPFVLLLIICLVIIHFLCYQLNLPKPSNSIFPLLKYFDDLIFHSCTFFWKKYLRKISKRN